MCLSLITKLTNAPAKQHVTLSVVAKSSREKYISDITAVMPRSRSRSPRRKERRASENKLRKSSSSSSSSSSSASPDRKPRRASSQSQSAGILIPFRTGEARYDARLFGSFLCVFFWYKLVSCHQSNQTVKHDVKQIQINTVNVCTNDLSVDLNCVFRPKLGKEKAKQKKGFFLFIEQLFVFHQLVQFIQR